MTLSDADIVAFLRWALPQLGLRWPGFRKVRRQVKRRIARRLVELGLADLGAYRALLQATTRPSLPLRADHPLDTEWATLDVCCRVTISRFYRDRGVWQALAPLLVERAQRTPMLRAWSVGCASGEEPYTLALLGQRYRLPPNALHVIASDASPAMLERARRARYPAASLADLPQSWRAAFEPAADAREGRPPDELVLSAPTRDRVSFFVADLRHVCLAAAARFDVILCRNLAFTYFDDATQRRTLEALRARLVDGALLVLGGHEALPDGGDGFAQLRPGLPIYRAR